MRLQADISLRKSLLGYFSHLEIFPSKGKDTLTKSDSGAWCVPPTEGSLREVRNAHALLMNGGSPRSSSSPLCSWTFLTLETHCFALLRWLASEQASWGLLLHTQLTHHHYGQTPLGAPTGLPHRPALQFPDRRTRQSRGTSTTMRDRPTAQPQEGCFFIPVGRKKPR